VEQAQEIALLKEVKGKVVEQAGRIAELEGEVSRLKESNAESTAAGGTPVQRPSGDVQVQTGDFAWIWRGVLFAGGLLEPGLISAGYLKGDNQLWFVGFVFQAFTWTCSLAAALGNPKNYGRKREKLFIGLCSLIPSLRYFVKAFIFTDPIGQIIHGLGTLMIWILGTFCVSKMYSKLSDRKLGAAVTALFKSLPGVLGSMLYVSAASLRCLMKYDSKVDEDFNDYYDEHCDNPTWPTYYVTMFLFTCWLLTNVIPPLLPGDRVLAWGDVMKLRMNMVEGLQFILFLTVSSEALLVYAFTNEDGADLSEFIYTLCIILQSNLWALGVVVGCHYVLKPLICRPSTRPQASSSVTSPNSDPFSVGSNSTVINSL